MRIGNIDDIHKSQDTDNLAALIKTDSRETMTKAEKRKNWWYYYKWYVVCGIIILLIACDIISSKLGLFEKSPDFQIAYIGESELPPDTAATLEKAFASLASDFNGDGEVIVQVNQYTTNSENTVPDTAYYAYASEITLIGDIENCDSYFFLMEDPERIQKEYQVLAAFDGSCPDKTDNTIEDKVIPLTECAAFADMNQEALSKLFIGRRCFFSDITPDNVDSCAHVWDLLTQSGGSSPVSSAENTSAASGDIAIGNYLSIQNIDNRLTLLNNLDTLSADGLYYASWGIGNAQSYKNSDGDTVDLYDASLYLLSGEFKNTQYAQENMDAWLTAAKKNYEVLNENEITCNGQTYSLITYNSIHEDNPYARGISAFSVYENCAVCIELTCRNEFTEDLGDILADFLEGCSYRD